MAILGFCDEQGNPQCTEQWKRVYLAFCQALPELWVDAESTGWISVHRKPDQSDDTVQVYVGDRKPGDEWGGKKYPAPGLELIPVNLGHPVYDAKKRFLRMEGDAHLGESVFFEGKSLDALTENEAGMAGVATAVRNLLDKYDPV